MWPKVPRFGVDGLIGLNDSLLRGCLTEKRCTNYRFTASGRAMLATVVQVPELDGTFIEVETMTGEGDAAAALADVRALMAQLGIVEDDLTSELYTDAVMRTRQQGRA
jgi:adenylate cyclase, class 2